jgi:phenylalanyl-tRNA synthetase beta subunit
MMDWLIADHNMEVLLKHVLHILKEPKVFIGPAKIYGDSEREDLYTRARIVFDSSIQMKMIQCECAELIAAISRLDIDHDTGQYVVHNVINKVAGVQIMIEQARRLLGSKLVDREVHTKLSQLEHSIEKIEKTGG